MSGLIPHSVPRRPVLLSAGATALLAACGQNAPPPVTGGPWEFTDDRGIKLSLPRRPERIVAQVTAAASLWNYGVRPIGTFGARRNPDGTPSVEVGNVDLAAVTSLGETYGEINLEQLASLRPDLLVSLYYSGDTVWGVEANVMPPLTAIAPLAAVKVQDVPITRPITRFQELSGLLGADLQSRANADAQAAFDKAANDLKAALAAKPDLKVMVIAGGAQSMSVANPTVVTDLIYFKSIGMDLVVPPVTTFWETLSWEQANKYAADLILTDSRSSTLNHEALMQKETWRHLPAVQAGQVAYWPWKTYSHLSYTKALNDLTEVVRKARPDIV
jgi:iron complex transport system substrate-binding protein